MSDALEKARYAVGRQLVFDNRVRREPHMVNKGAVEAIEALVDAKVNAILDAREAKAAPDDGGGAQTKAMVGRLDREISRMDALVATKDARIAELERALGERDREISALREGGAMWLDRAEKAEAALAELRGRGTEAGDKLQWDIDHPATMGHDRGEIIAVLTHPTTPDALLTDPEAQPARDTDPVPATVLLIRESYRPAREGETPAFIDLEFGPMVRRKARSIARRAAGITGKGTSDD